MLSLTRQERLVLIFVGFAALLGVGLNFHKKIQSGVSLERIAQEQNSRLPINLNTASLQNLAVIPGVGPGLAQDLVDFRNQEGPFKSLEEIKLIRGVSLSKFNQIKNFLTVE